MISVDIISKIVTRGTGKTPTMVGGESNINLSDYLLKEIWEKVFEIKTDEAGNEYIFGKLPVVTMYGITMYADGDGVEVPSIYDGLPIDGQTLIWDETDGGKILKINPNIELGGGLDEVELYNYLTNNNYAKKSDITTSLNGYATTSSLNAVSTKLNDFLEGSDTDIVINKWKELETFLSGLTESDNLATILTGKADKSYVDTNFVTIAGTEDVTGLHNFVNGLKVGGIELIQKNGNAFLRGNLVVEGGITMYGDGEGGSSVPSYSTLGSLLNVDESNDAVASVDRVLFQSAGSNVWSWKPLSEIGGGSSGGSVSGDYLPLTGGTLTGGVVIAPSASYATAITDSCSVLKLGSDTSGMNGYNSGLGFNALQRYSSRYLLHLHAWIGLSPCISSEGSELYDLVFATNGSTTVETSPIERMRITHDGSVKIQRLFFGNTNEINSTNGSTLCLNYEGTGNILMSNNGQGVVVASGWSGLSSKTQQRLRKSMFSVRGGIFSYMEDVMSNAAAYVFDKPGLHFTGIGSNGEANTIYFGAVDTTNLYSWVSYSQIWKFGGSIVTTGGITMYSDQRKKTILNHVELSLKQIADAPLIEHYYNSDQDKTTHVGSIAQYWAGLNDWFCKLDAEGFYTMDIQNCALASAISIARHLEKYESKTDKTIQKMKKRIQELEDEVERLKQN